MKKVTAIFFSLIYLGFLAGVAVSVDAVSMLSSESFELKEAQNGDGKIVVNEFAPRVHKELKHLAATSKIKLPRSKFVAFESLQLLSSNNYRPVLVQLVLSKQLSNSSPIYLRNRVLRI